MKKGQYLRGRRSRPRPKSAFSRFWPRPKNQPKPPGNRHDFRRQREALPFFQIGRFSGRFRPSTKVDGRYACGKTTLLKKVSFLQTSPRPQFHEPSEARRVGEKTKFFRRSERASHFFKKVKFTRMGANFARNLHPNGQKPKKVQFFEEKLHKNVQKMHKN